MQKIANARIYDISYTVIELKTTEIKRIYSVLTKQQKYQHGNSAMKTNVQCIIIVLASKSAKRLGYCIFHKRHENANFKSSCLYSVINLYKILIQQLQI